jgi:hypothetical protein
MARDRDEAESAVDDIPLVEIPASTLPDGDELSAVELSTAHAVFLSNMLEAARVKELRLAPPGVEVMECEKLRVALGDMGFIVGGTHLFELVAMVDPTAIGVFNRDTWLAAIRYRKRVAAQAAKEAEQFKAYIALGGTIGKTERVPLKPLVDVIREFGLDVDIGCAMKAVVEQRMHVVADLLAMGGELDDDEVDQFQNTSHVDFADLRAFSGYVAAHANGPKMV